MILRSLTTVLALLALLSGTSARAGVYLPAENPVLVPMEAGQAKPMPVSEFQNVVYPAIRSLGIPLPGKPHGSDQTQTYRQRRDTLLHKGLSNLSADEMISLSGYQIRLRELGAAEATLAAAGQRFRDRFEIYANLAVVKFQSGRADEALLNQPLVLDLMRSAHLPANLPRDWLLKAERKQLELFRLRRKEAITAGGRRRQPDHFDRLFPDETFRDPKARSEAIALVQQLLLWLPDDARLYWLLGELYQSAGDWSAAARIFDDCANARGFSPPLLKEHRRLVKAKLAEMPAEPVPLLPELPAPGADSPPSGPAADWLPNHKRLLAVGIGGVLLLLALGYFQWRELRRRWRADAPGVAR